jgi:predicted TIM-barrel fold metal-dependent hydrolase
MSPIEHYLALAKTIGIERGVIVHPGRVYGADYRVTLAALETAKAQGFPLRAVVTMTIADPEICNTDYETLHKYGVRGVRLNFTRLAFGSFDAVLLKKAVERISFLGWLLELQIDADFIAANYEFLTRIDLPIILDQLAHLPNIDDPAFGVVIDLLKRGNFWVKFAAVERFVTLQKLPYRDLSILANSLASHAPDRIIWGTDWPHTQRYEPGLTPNEGELVDMMLDLIPDVTVREKLFVKNAGQLFGFDRS